MIIFLSKNARMHAFFRCFYSTTHFFVCSIVFLVQIPVFPLLVNYLHSYAFENKPKFGVLLDVQTAP